MQKFQIGEKVYVNNTFVKAGEFVVKGFVPKDEGLYVLCRETSNTAFFAFEPEIFSTKEEAHKAIAKEKEKNIKLYCDKIKDVEDLIVFPLIYCISDEEYPNLEAQEAYKIRAKELLGVDCEAKVKETENF